LVSGSQDVESQAPIPRNQTSCHSWMSAISRMADGVKGRLKNWMTYTLMPGVITAIRDVLSGESKGNEVMGSASWAKDVAVREGLMAISCSTCSLYISSRFLHVGGQRKRIPTEQSIGRRTRVQYSPLFFNNHDVDNLLIPLFSWFLKVTGARRVANMQQSQTGCFSCRLPVLPLPLVIPLPIHRQH
jgi:hypothetical protein